MFWPLFCAASLLIASNLMTDSRSKFLSEGDKRFRLYKREHQNAFNRGVGKRLLDFGCGEGRFVFAALRNGHEAYGVEVDDERERQFVQNAERFQNDARNAFYKYDGLLLPFENEYFDSIYSWFVFEHVESPQTSLREIARVLKPGGTIIIHADDVKNCWDGHFSAPIPPYLPKKFIPAYLEGLGKKELIDFIISSVVYICAEDVQNILVTLGLDVAYLGPKKVANPALVREGLNVDNEASARRLGEKVRNAAPFISPIENLILYATKPNVGPGK